MLTLAPRLPPPYRRPAPREVAPRVLAPRRGLYVPDRRPRPRRHRPWCPMYRGPLRAMGLPAATSGVGPLCFPGVAPMAGCCCGTSGACDIPDITYGCADCADGTPESYTVSISGVTCAATGCYDCSPSPEFPISTEIVADLDAAINGTRCYTRLGRATNQDPCSWFNGALGGTEPLARRDHVGSHDCTGSSSEVRGFLGDLQVDYEAFTNRVFVTLTISSTAFPGEYFNGQIVFSSPTSFGQCYFEVTIPNDNSSLDCNIWGAGGSATVVACC